MVRTRQLSNHQFVRRIFGPISSSFFCVFLGPFRSTLRSFPPPPRPPRSLFFRFGPSSAYRRSRRGGRSPDDRFGPNLAPRKQNARGEGAGAPPASHGRNPRRSRCPCRCPCPAAINPCLARLHAIIKSLVIHVRHVRSWPQSGGGGGGMTAAPPCLARLIFNF